MFFLENSAFFSKFRSQNFNKKCAQNAGNRISEALDFKWSYASVNPHAGSAPWFCPYSISRLKSFLLSIGRMIFRHLMLNDLPFSFKFQTYFDSSVSFAYFAFVNDFLWLLCRSLNRPAVIPK